MSRSPSARRSWSWLWWLLLSIPFVLVAVALHASDDLPLSAAIMVAGAFAALAVGELTGWSWASTFVYRALFFGAGTQAFSAVTEDDPFSALGAAVTGFLFAALIAVWDHFSDDSDEEPSVDGSRSEA